MKCATVKQAKISFCLLVLMMTYLSNMFVTLVQAVQNAPQPSLANSHGEGNNQSLSAFTA